MTTLTAVVLTSLIAAPIPKEEPKKGIEGEWKVVEFVKGGTPREKDRLGTVTFKGDQMTISMTTNGRKRDETLTFTLDPKAKPMTIDLRPVKGANDQGVRKDQVVKGIYKLEKDKLTICFGLDATERPKEFKSEKDSKVGMFVLERVKK
jgi:uncharacterized protein (TIGR03067 family)